MVANKVRLKPLGCEGKPRGSTLLWLVVSLMLVSPPLGAVAVYAQDGPSGEVAGRVEGGEGTAADEEFVDTIVVTAHKREEELSEVPASLVVIDSNAIAEAGIVQVQELSEMAPNFQLPNHGADIQNRVTIRGVGANSRNIGFDTRVGVYLDGVYLGQSPAVNFDLLDLQRVELLRGPQGTLYGKNSVAGALNLVTQAPTDSFSGRVRAKAGELGNREVSLLLNGPLNDRARGRISILNHQQDGHIRNTFTGTELMDQDSTSYRGQLLFLASDSVSFKAAVDGLISDRFIAIGEATTDTFGLVALDSPRFETEFGLDPREERDLIGAAVTAESVNTGGSMFRSITGFRDSTVDFDNDVDYSIFDFARVDYQDRYRQLSQEFQWLSPQEGKISYVVGAYLYSQEGKTRRDVPLGADIVLLGPAELTGLIPGNVIRNKGTVDTESYAVFGEAKWLAGDRSTVNLGVRVSNERKRADWVLDGSQSGIFGIGSGSVQDSRTATNVSPALSWVFNATASTNVYFRAATGFKSGGFNLDFITPTDLEAGIEFDDETVVSFEAGLKVQAVGGRLRFNLAVFDSEYDDYQVNQFLDLGGGATSISIRNAADVTTQGVEADLSYRGRSGLELNASLGLLDTEFTRFPGGGTGGADASGNELPFAPENSFSLGAGKTWAVGSGAIFLARADFSHTGSQFTTVSNIKEQPLAFGGTVPYGYLDAYDLINARLGFISKSGKIEAYVWGRNLGDERYQVASFRDFFGTVLDLQARPSTVGAEIILNF